MSGHGGVESLTGFLEKNKRLRMSKTGKGKGGKNRRRGKGDKDGKRELVFKEELQEYAQVRFLALFGSKCYPR